MYKVELTCRGQPIGGHLSFSSRLDPREVEELACSMLQVARENDTLLKPDGYRVAFVEDGLKGAGIPQTMAIGGQQSNLTRRRPHRQSNGPIRSILIADNIRPLSKTIMEQNQRITNIIRFYDGLPARLSRKKNYPAWRL